MPGTTRSGRTRGAQKSATDAATAVRARQLYVAARLTVGVIATRLGITPHTVRRMLREQGITLEKRDRT